MTESSPFALASVPAVSSDPRLLTLHLDICRMRAELELLESRIARIRASEAEAAADSRPFADRAEELVERTVASLLDAGRAELEATDRQSRLDAEARLAEASRRAQELLDAARADLADALTERADLEEARRRSGADVVILPDDGLVVLPGDDLVVLPDDGLAVAPGDDAVVPSGEGLIVLPGDDLVVLPDDGLAVAPGDDAVVPSGEGLIVLPGDELVLAFSTPGPVDESGPVAAPDFALEAVAPSEGGVSGAGATSAPRPPADAGADSGAAPAPSASAGLPRLGGSWADERGSSRTSSETTETARADVAFDVWLAMAPPSPAEEGATDEGDEPSPPGWLRPLEAAAALLLVALLVAVALLVVG